MAILGKLRKATAAQIADWELELGRLQAEHIEVLQRAQIISARMTRLVDDIAEAKDELEAIKARIADRGESE